VVQGRIRQQDADHRIARRERSSELARVPARGQHDRPLDRKEQRALGGPKHRNPFSRLEVAHHDRERFLVALLPTPKTQDRQFRRGITREVKATNTLDRDDEPAPISRAATSIGSSSASVSPAAVTAVSEGPHTGQAFGWAWKRRSDGSSYSRWHAGHIWNRTIDVLARS
jgi:hypothetical protein